MNLGYDKKAVTFALKKVLNLILAVLVIVMLIWLSVLLYKLFLSNAAEENVYKQAKENLERISNIINSLEDGGNDKIEIFYPQDWVLYLDGKRIATCKKQYLYFGTENYQDIVDSCGKNGFQEFVRYDLETLNFCPKAGGIKDQKFDNCFLYDNLPIQIVFERQGDKVVMKRETDRIGQGRLTNYWDYKLSEDEMTLLELSKSYIDSNEEQEEFLENKIGDTITAYIQEKDIVRIYAIRDSELFWIYGIYEMYGDNPVEPVLTLKKVDSFVLEEQLYSENFDFSHNNKKYRIVFNLQKGTEKDLDYFDPSFIST